MVEEAVEEEVGLVEVCRQERVVEEAVEEEVGLVEVYR